MVKETEANEMVQHTIVIDKYATAVLSIPKVMDAMQFKGLVVKANKLFNLSTDEVIESMARKTSPVAQADRVMKNLEAGLTPTGRKKRTVEGPQVKWTRAMDEALVKMFAAGKSAQEMVDELSKRFPSERNTLTKKRVRVRTWFLKKGKIGWQREAKR